MKVKKTGGTYMKLIPVILATAVVAGVAGTAAYETYSESNKGVIAEVKAEREGSVKTEEIRKAFNRKIGDPFRLNNPLVVTDPKHIRAHDHLSSALPGIEVGVADTEVYFLQEGFYLAMITTDKVKAVGLFTYPRDPRTTNQSLQDRIKTEYQLCETIVSIMVPSVSKKEQEKLLAAVDIQETVTQSEETRQEMTQEGWRFVRSDSHFVLLEERT